MEEGNMKGTTTVTDNQQLWWRNEDGRTASAIHFHSISLHSTLWRGTACFHPMPWAWLLFSLLFNVLSVQNTERQLKACVLGPKKFCRSCQLSRSSYLRPHISKNIDNNITWSDHFSIKFCMLFCVVKRSWWGLQRYERNRMQLRKTLLASASNLTLSYTSESSVTTSNTLQDWANRSLRRVTTNEFTSSLTLSD